MSDICKLKPGVRWSRYPLPDVKFTVWTKLFGPTISTHALASTNRSCRKSEVQALFRIIVGLNRIIVTQNLINSLS